jgi:ankyrin repeat protein
VTNGRFSNLLEVAARQGRVDTLRFLLRHPAMAPLVDRGRGTPTGVDEALMAASEAGHAPIVACLIDYGAGLDEQDGDGTTAHPSERATAVMPW